MKKIATSLRLLLAISFTAGVALGNPASGASAKWEKAIAAYEKADAQSPPPKNGIEFIGSSTMVRWKTLQQDFAGLPVFNRGFGGSRIRDTTAFATRIIIPYAPKIIVFHAGDNDLAAGATSQQVIADFKELVALIQANLPQTEFCYISLKPSAKRKQLRLDQQQVNQGIQEFTKNAPRVHYIDQYNLVIDAEGEPRPELFVADGLHLSEVGYQLLVARVRPFLNK